jgi:hypothetical protein
LLLLMPVAVHDVSSNLASSPEVQALNRVRASAVTAILTVLTPVIVPSPPGTIGPGEGRRNRKGAQSRSVARGPARDAISEPLLAPALPYFADCGAIRSSLACDDPPFMAVTLTSIQSFQSLRPNASGLGVKQLLPIRGVGWWVNDFGEFPREPSDL